ncbi:ANTAR domain-containing response regulator [Desulforamulus aquiferis]|uniref:Stage 0 sporulation protein A homolog n=1 Tax=Desulforamulus aquiferis TaxID=1397668 RepID=A0AAW7Z938_9FIRM|nr:response regulator [Desulforamulus aquiferis]MDO7785769.1 response regulator [Desulforamulus aquiferis]
MFERRVLLADPDLEYRKKLRDLLRQHGYLVVAETEDGRGTLQAAFQNQPNLVIMESDMPGCKGLEVARLIEENRLAPVVLVTSQTHRELIEEAKVSSVLGYLIKPIDEASLIPTIEMALATFKRITKMEEENRKLKMRLEEKNLVEQAKHLLMEKKGFSEQAAYRFIQKTSMDRASTMARVAQQVIVSLKPHV